LGLRVGGWERTHEEVEEVRKIHRGEVDRIREVQMPVEFFII